MTNVRMVYLLEEETQLNLIQLRVHLKLLSLLINPRFRQDEHHSLPIPLQPLSDHFASRAHETSHIFDQFCWHSGKPNVEPASDAQQKRGLLVPALCYSQAISNLVGGFSTLIQLIIFTT